MTRCQRCFGDLPEFVVFCPNCAQVHEPDLSQLLNQTVGDRYKLYRRLGQGGLSTVFAATDLQTDSVVVVKVSDPAQLVRRELTYAIDAEAARNYWQEMLERMRHEAEALTGIDHPNIVRFFDTGMVGEDLRFVVMEFLRGRMLREELDERGRLEIAEGADIALQLCDALGEVHARGIVHRDISPRNVMIADCGLRIADSDVAKHFQSSINTSSEETVVASKSAIRNPQSVIKLIDFGIAKFPQPPGAPPFTQHSVLSGTVAYASPEQCQSRAVDHRSDIYSMGVMLYEMLTGERPFTGRTPTEIAIKHLQAEPQPPRQLNPAIPANLEKTILRALAKAPEDRQQSVQELAKELRSSSRQVVIPLLDQVSADLNSGAETDHLMLVRRRRRRVVVAAAALLLAVLAGGIFGRNWLASRALPLFAAAQPSASPLPEDSVVSDSDSLELAAQLPADSLAGGGQMKNAASPSPSATQSVRLADAQSAVQTPGNASPNVSAKPQTSEIAKSQSQVLPAPTPTISINQPANKPVTVQKAEERKIRQRDVEDSANANNNREEVTTARRDRIAANRNRQEENSSGQSGSGPDSGNVDSGSDEPETANRPGSGQIGPKLIQWSGKVNGEREVVIDLPGMPGVLEIPRVYRNRVGMIEPPSATNRWRCARLRVFGEGGVSFVVRWWPHESEVTRLAPLIGRK